jgi:hypothetical protein
MVHSSQFISTNLIVLKVIAAYATGIHSRKKTIFQVSIFVLQNDFFLNLLHECDFEVQYLAPFGTGCM